MGFRSRACYRYIQDTGKLVTGRRLVSVEASAEAVVAVAKKYHFFSRIFFEKIEFGTKMILRSKCGLGSKSVFRPK